MEMVNRSELHLSQLSGGTGKGASSSSTSESNSVVVLNVGQTTSSGTEITAGGVTVKA